MADYDLYRSPEVFTGRFLIPSPGKPSLIFVSHYNREDMVKKLREIQHDPDIIRWIDAGCERLMKDIYARRPFA